MGMGGGVLIPKHIPRPVIRSEGRRLGYEGDGLEDFTEIVAGIDDFFVEISVRKVAADAKAAADKSRRQAGR